MLLSLFKALGCNIDNMSVKSRNNIFLAIGSVAIIASSGMGVYALYSSTQNSTNSGGSSTAQLTTPGSSSSGSTTTDTSSTNMTGVSSSSASTNGYKDGTYTASANYSVPHGYQNSISVSITVSNGSITAASATHSTSDRESAEYTDVFDSSLSSKVVGQSLSGASFSRIGGASLTTDGFQTALETVMNEAAA